MKLLSIVAEYNPFHNGHKYHLLKSLEKSHATHSMAVMSGSFLQRGEPALVDKWIRAQIAVKSGLDLVAELPFVYSCQSAEIFAYGAISTLHSLNVVEAVSFQYFLRYSSFEFDFEYKLPQHNCLRIFHGDNLRGPSEWL